MRRLCRPFFGVLVIWLALLAVGGCSGSDVAGSGQTATSTVQAPIPAGNPAGSAVDALSDFSAAPVDDADIFGGVLLTRLTMVLRPEATLGDLQAAARLVGATGLAHSRRGSLFVDLVVPRQPDPRSLQELAERLQGRPGVLFAEAGTEFDVLELPPAGGPPVDTLDLLHMLAPRFPGAWNVRRLAGSPTQAVPVVVIDSYSGPHVNFDQQLEGSAPVPEFIPGRQNRHGYQVVGTLAARFDALQSHGANPVPRSLSLTLDQMAGLSRNQGLDQMFAAIERARGPARPVIVNLSLGVNNQASAELFGNRPEDVRSRMLGHYLDGLHWAQLTRDPDFADQVMLVVAAGNDRGKSLTKDYPGLQDGRLSTPFAIAAVADRLEDLATDPGLWNPPGAGLGDLRLAGAELADLLAARDAVLAGRTVTRRNLVLVGSLDFQERLDRVTVSSFSNNGAELFAVGESVATIPEEGEGESGGEASGTSFAAPQVAGLASYLWLLDETLRAEPVQKTLQLMRATSRGNAKVTGVIDAYGAVLALDARRGDFRMRRELLDVSGPGGVPDSRFNELDLQEFERVYGLANPAGPPEPNLRDYSRYDLNGDGFTGGTRKERFDLDAAGLDANGAPMFNLVQVDVEGARVDLDEEALSDLDILKFYSYLTGSDGQPLLYDTSSPEALQERRRIFSGDPDLLVVTLVGNSRGDLTSISELITSCGAGDQPVGNLVRDFPTTSQPLPFTMSAGSASVSIVKASPSVVTVDFSATLPASAVCGIRDVSSVSGFDAFVVLVASKPGVLRIESRTGLDSPPTVVLTGLTALRPFHEERLSFRIESRDQPQVFNGRTATFTFTPDNP